MDWEDDSEGHANDFDNQRSQDFEGQHIPFSDTPLSSEAYADAGWIPLDAEDSLTPLKPAETGGFFAPESLDAKFVKRLDYLLPIDSDTGVTTHQAVCTYLDAMIEMVSRHGQPLSVLSIAVDDSPILRFLGVEGAALIGRAVGRCLRQETRTQDVVGHADPTLSPDAFTFLVTCPLLTEEQAAGLAERLRAAMTTHSGNAEHPWLTMSVGVAAMSLDVTESRLMVARSMDALRRARRAGGGRVWRHTDTLRAIMERTEPEPDVRDGDESHDESSGA